MPCSRQSRMRLQGRGQKLAGRPRSNSITAVSRGGAAVQPLHHQEPQRHQGGEHAVVASYPGFRLSLLEQARWQQLLEAGSELEEGEARAVWTELECRERNLCENSSCHVLGTE